MNKSVLASIKPKDCELITSGKKTVEIRKNRPKIDVPFKCYIYCTKKFDAFASGRFQWDNCGKVIGEFVCDNISAILPTGEINVNICTKSCLTATEITTYQKKEWVYAWHISERVIYDKPKELSEFGLTRPPQS